MISQGTGQPQQTKIKWTRLLGEPRERPETNRYGPGGGRNMFIDPVPVTHGVNVKLRRVLGEAALLCPTHWPVVDPLRPRPCKSLSTFPHWGSCTCMSLDWMITLMTASFGCCRTVFKVTLNHNFPSPVRPDCLDAFVIILPFTEWHLRPLYQTTECGYG